MSLHFHLLVELDLAADLSGPDLDVVRWLVAAGPKPPSAPGDLAPLLYPDPVRPDDTPAVVGLPGGQSAGLLRRSMPAPAARPTSCWSLAVRALLLDDTLYGPGFASLAWLGRRAFQDGFFAQVREEFDPTPAWVFVAVDGWTYAIVDGEVGALDPAAPPPPPALQEAAGAREPDHDEVRDPA